MERSNSVGRCTVVVTGFLSPSAYGVQASRGCRGGVAGYGHGSEAGTAERGGPWRCRGPHPDAQGRSDLQAQVGLHGAIADHNEAAGQRRRNRGRRHRVVA
jgi:hypothetical protein